MTDIEAKALALVNEVLGEWGKDVRYSSLGRLGNSTSEALCRAIEAHEAFRQEVSDAVRDYTNDGMPRMWHGFYRFIVNKPDPLAELLEEIRGEGGFDSYNHYAHKLRAALEARGLEIVEKSQ